MDIPITGNSGRLDAMYCGMGGKPLGEEKVYIIRNCLAVNLPGFKAQACSTQATYLECNMKKERNRLLVVGQVGEIRLQLQEYIVFFW